MPHSLSILLFTLLLSSSSINAFQQANKCLSPASRPSLGAPCSSGFKSPFPIQQSPPQNLTPSPTGTLRKETKLDAFTVSTALAVADTFWKSSPYTAAALICAIKGSIADLVAQKFFQGNKKSDAPDNAKNLPAAEKKAAPYTLSQRSHEEKTPSAQEETSPKADWKRNIAYAAYGSLYQGVTQEYLYNHLYPIIFGAGTDFRTVAIKVVFNMLVQSPLLTLPVAYLVKAILYKQTFRTAMKKYIHDVRYNGLLTKFILLWGPVQSLVFSVVPPHLRVSVIAVVSFFWMIILSCTASNSAPADAKA